MFMQNRFADVTGDASIGSSMMLDATRESLSQCAAYQEVVAKGDQIMASLEKGVDGTAALIFDNRKDRESRLHIAGSLLQSTLLATEHRGGYNICALDKLRQDFREDTGLDLEMLAHFFDFENLKQMIMSSNLESYVSLSHDSDGKCVIKGKPFENELLNDLLFSQLEASKLITFRELSEKQEKLARLREKVKDPIVLQNKLRFLETLGALKAHENYVEYATVQAKFKAIHNIELNKVTCKEMFCRAKPKDFLVEMFVDDVSMKFGHEATGELFVKLKAPYEDLKAKYEEIMTDKEKLDQEANKVQERIDQIKNPRPFKKWANKPKKLGDDQNTDESRQKISNKSGQMRSARESPDEVEEEQDKENDANETFEAKEPKRKVNARGYTKGAEDEVYSEDDEEDEEDEVDDEPARPQVSQVKVTEFYDLDSAFDVDGEDGEGDSDTEASNEMDNTMDESKVKKAMDSDKNMRSEMKRDVNTQGDELLKGPPKPAQSRKIKIIALPAKKPVTVEVTKFETESNKSSTTVMTSTKSSSEEDSKENNTTTDCVTDRQTSMDVKPNSEANLTYVKKSEQISSSNSTGPMVTGVTVGSQSSGTSHYRAEGEGSVMSKSTQGGGPLKSVKVAEFQVTSIIRGMLLAAYPNSLSLTFITERLELVKKENIFLQNIDPNSLIRRVQGISFVEVINDEYVVLKKV